MQHGFQTTRALVGPTARQELGAATAPTITTETVRCLECATEFETSRVPVIGKPGESLIVDLYCSGCRKAEDDRLRLQAQPLAQRDLKAEWAEICPRQFLETDPERIPEAVKEPFRSYRYSNLGILTVGRTGTFKSRMMHLLAKRLFFEGHRVKLYDSVKLGAEIADSFDNDGYSVLLDNLSIVECLFIDDIDKMRLTPRVQEGLYAIVNLRYTRKLPTFYTTNLRGAELEKLFAAQYGEPLRRRLRESCIQIETDKLLGR